MIVGGSYFEGDADQRVAWKQHDVYHNALGIIVAICNEYTNVARFILDDADHSEWGTVETFDHRTLQHGHDLIAAVWRFRSDYGYARLPFDGKDTLDEVQTLWLHWLRLEVDTWIRQPCLIRSVQLILAHQNKPTGYEAESKFCTEIVGRFSDMPWAKRIHDAYGGY